MRTRGSPGAGSRWVTCPELSSRPPTTSSIHKGGHIRAPRVHFPGGAILLCGPPEHKRGRGEARTQWHPEAPGRARCELQRGRPGPTYLLQDGRGQLLGQLLPVVPQVTRLVLFVLWEGGQWPHAEGGLGHLATTFLGVLTTEAEGGWTLPWSRTDAMRLDS